MEQELFLKIFIKTASLGPVSDTTNYRLPVEIAERLSKILTKAGDGTPVAKMMATLLLEQIQQIETEGSQIAATPTARRLRQQLGFSQTAPEAKQAVDKLDEITATLLQMQKRLDEVASGRPSERSPGEQRQAQGRRSQGDPPAKRQSA